MELTMKYDIIQTSDRDTVPAFDPTTFWTEFRHGMVTVKGLRLHFVEGGHGDPVLLLPGWPQSWYAWRYVMPLLLAAGRRVIALDPRGMGDSDRPASGYDLRTVTGDVHGLVEALGLTAKGRVDVVYRHVFSPEGLEQSRARTERQLRPPILAFGADMGVGTGLVDTMRLVATDVRGGVFEGCGHYMPEEAPRSVAEQIVQFMGV
jgi:pimeloyl-ACP methyl ester carboxylesterase